MLGFPVSTEFNKRIPKQKFYENLDISPTLRRVFVDQIRIVYWRNKLAASTLNIAAGEAVTVSNNLRMKVSEPPSTRVGLNYIRQQYLDLSGIQIGVRCTNTEYRITLPLL